ncbi:hypothetical protein VPHK394_0031 [Vibrio phage K394]
MSRQFEWAVMSIAASLAFVIWFNIYLEWMRWKV